MTKKLKSLNYLKEFIEEIYDYPGIYKMLDSQKKLLYIGKAKNLKKRLSNYLNFESLCERMKSAISLLFKIEIIITKTEKEALILEAQLIRSLKPKYNILLKTEKAYNFIWQNENFPDFPSFEIFQTKNMSSNSATRKKLFGPFFSSFQIKQILDVIYKNFQIRSCQDFFFKNHLAQNKTCMQFDLGRCSGPCAKKIDTQEYKNFLKDAVYFLQGNTNSLIKNLEDKMLNASENCNFETAILFREKIKALKNFYSKQYLGANFDGDYIVFLHQENFVIIVRNRIFGGNNYGNQSYFFENILSKEEFFEIIEKFLVQLFLEVAPLPHVYCNLLPKNYQEIIFTVKEITNQEKNFKFIVPVRGRKNEIIQNILLNAHEQIKLKLNKIKDNLNLIEDIKIWLKINPEKKIDRIEIYDNSHMMGKNSIGGVVVFSVQNGFIKKDYRAYHIKSTTLPNDYQMLREVLIRRFPKNPLPDLIIIDGGAGHLNVAKNTLEDIVNNNLEIEIISIAKGEKRENGLETIFLADGEKLKTFHEDPKIHFLQRLRDEAHRFAITKHKVLRDKSVFKK